MRQICNFWNPLQFICLAVMILSSCVPNKKLVYLQADNELKMDKNYDSILESYDLKRERYILSPEDVISLRVASVTPENYNFIKKYETDLGIIRRLNQYDRAESNQNNSSQPIMGNGMGNSNSDNGGPNIATIILDRLNTGFSLDMNGELQLPPIGKIKLSGLTIAEAEKLVTDSLEGYFEAPMVRIQLLDFHFTILGEVENEGRYTSFDPDIHVFDAITMAGNLTDYADRANIKIIHQDGERAGITYIDLLDEHTLMAENLYLKKGDIIIIPGLNARVTSKYILPNFSIAIGTVSAVLSVLTIFLLSNR